MSVSQVSGYIPPSTQFGALPQPGVYHTGYGSGRRKQASWYSSDAAKGSVGLLALGTYFHKYLRALLPESVPFALKPEPPPRSFSQTNMATFLWSALGLSALIAVAVAVHKATPHSGATPNTPAPTANTTSGVRKGAGTPKSSILDNLDTKTITIKQGSDGNTCYLLAGLMSAMKQPQGLTLLKTLYETDGTKEFIKTPSGRIEITQADKDATKDNLTTNNDVIRVIVAGYKKLAGTQLGQDNDFLDAFSKLFNKNTLTEPYGTNLDDLPWNDKSAIHIAGAQKIVQIPGSTPIPDGHYYSIERTSNGQYIFENPLSNTKTTYANSQAFSKDFHAIVLRIPLT
jgi:hypothetical protein